MLEPTGMAALIQHHSAMGENINYNPETQKHPPLAYQLLIEKCQACYRNLLF